MNEIRKFGILATVLACSAMPSLPATAGTWSGFNNAPPSGFSNCLLLTDGTVMCANGGNAWYKLTPDSSGSYKNGTWSQLASMTDTRLYYSSMVLPNGNVYVAGGEYGTGGSDARGEIYNPLTNSWSFTANMPFTATDAEAILIANGNVLQTNSQSTTAQYSPNTNAWSNTLNGPDTNETDWVKLADDSILQITSYGQNTARYIPSSASWVNDGTVPVALFGYGGELGSGHLLPNGKVFWLGATSNTAIYTPSGNSNPGSWVAGPQIPGSNGAVDSSAAMMTTGNVLCAVGTTSGFGSATYFYEYNYTTNSFTQVNGPTGTTDGTAPYTTSMLDLPDGTVLYQGTGLYLYTPSGTVLAAGKPAITGVTANGDGSYTLTGTLLNGISQGAKYGDDKQMNSNYPIVRLTNTSTGTVYYARTYSWSSTSVMTGSKSLNTHFTLPGGMPNGTYNLVAVANGNPSSAVTFTLGGGVAPSNGVHTLTPSCATGSRLDDNAAGTTNGNKVQIWTANGSQAQNWNFASVGTNTWNLAVNLGPYCLDGGAAQVGTPTQIWSCNGTVDQQWVSGPAAQSGAYNFASKQSGLCLDVSGAGSANGTVVQEYTCNGTPAQAWTLH